MTTINAIYQIGEATKIFGPYGLGFGIKEIKYENFEYEDEKNRKCLNLEGHAVFFYIHEGKEVTFNLSSSVSKISYTKDYKDKSGYQKVDGDCYKKLETDITTKALSKLGFSADIFKGMYDDIKYVEALREEFIEADLEEITQSIKECGDCITLESLAKELQQQGVFLHEKVNPVFNDHMRTLYVEEVRDDLLDIDTHAQLEDYYKNTLKGWQKDEEMLEVFATKKELLLKEMSKEENRYSE